MYFNKIRLIGLTTIDLPVAVGKASDRYILKDVDGLGPPPVAVSIATSTIPGGTYQGRRPENRNLVFKIGLNANYKLNQTPATLRDELYGLLTPETSEAVQIQFLNGETIVAKTFGYTGNIVPVYFAKEPEVQITIECTEPYLDAPNMLTLQPTPKNSFVVPNAGNAPTGFSFEVIFTSDINVFVLYGLGSEQMRFDFPFFTNDRLQVSTIYGNRYVQVVRPPRYAPWIAETFSILHSLTPASVFLQLRGGNNIFTTNNQNWDWGFFKYTPQYWGI